MKLNRIFYNKDVINDKYTKTLRRKVTMLVENQCITVRNYITITKENSSDYSKRSCCLSTRHTQWEKKKKKLLFTSLSSVPAKKPTPSAAGGFFNSFSATANLHYIYKTFNLTHSSVGKSKFETHQTCIEIIKRF